MVVFFRLNTTNYQLLNLFYSINQNIQLSRLFMKFLNLLAYFLHLFVIEFFPNNYSIISYII